MSRAAEGNTFRRLCRKGKLPCRTNSFRPTKFSPTSPALPGWAGSSATLSRVPRCFRSTGSAASGVSKPLFGELTDLPVMMAATHGHIDHVGAAWRIWGAVYPPGRIPLMYTAQHSAPEGRLAFAELLRTHWEGRSARSDPPDVSRRPARSRPTRSTAGISSTSAAFGWKWWMSPATLGKRCLPRSGRPESRIRAMPVTRTPCCASMVPPLSRDTRRA